MKKNRKPLKKHALAAMLSVCMALTLMPSAALAAEETAVLNGGTITELTAANLDPIFGGGNYTLEGTTVTLTKDFVPDSNFSNVIISIPLTLDLGGKSIDCTGASNMQGLFYINETASGTEIRNGSLQNAPKGYLVSVFDNVGIALEDLTISGCASDGSSKVPVYLKYGATCRMKNVKVINNTMTNRISNRYGAVCFYMGTLYIEGDIQILNNTSGDSPTKRNTLWSQSTTNANAIIVTGSLAPTARIGVNFYSSLQPQQEVIVAKADASYNGGKLTESDFNAFVADNPNVELFFEDGMVKLRQIYCKISQQPTDLTIKEGAYTNQKLTVETESVESSVYWGYQWFQHTIADNQGGTPLTAKPDINKLTESSYSIPDNLSKGTYYYYCVVQRCTSDEITIYQLLTSSVATVRVTGDLPPEVTPNIEIDYKGEKLTGFASGGSFTVNGAAVSPAADGTLAIEAGWLGSEISIVRQASDADHEDSAPQKLTLPSRPAAPTNLTAINETASGAEDGKIIGLSAGTVYQTSTDGGASWNDKTADGDGAITGLAPGSYILRVKNTSSAFMSMPSAAVTIVAYEDIPPTGGVSGTVTDENSAAASGVTMEVRVGDTNSGALKSTAVTDSSGAYSITGLDYGVYTVVARKAPQVVTSIIEIKAAVLTRHVQLPNG